MTIYEFVTPSDPITFKAEDDKIAYACALFLGSGKAGCRNTETEKSLPTMIIFSDDPVKEIVDFLGCELQDFVKPNKQKIIDCFKSFAYGDISNRQTFDDALAAITDPEQLKLFLERHDDKNRSSLSKWVKAAWGLAKEMEEQTED